MRNGWNIQTRGDSLASAMDKFVSKTGQATCGAQLLYSNLSDFRFLSQALSQSDQISDLSTGDDLCSFNLKGMGPVSIQIVEREPYKLVKLSHVDKKPLEFYVWFQFVEVNPRDTRIRITLHVAIPLLLRPLLGKKIQKGLDQTVDQLAQAFSRF